MMPTPRTPRFRLILAAVDFSRQSAKALRYAAATAAACGGRVRVVHAIDPLLTTAAARAYSARALVEDTETELRRFVRSTLGSSAPQQVEVLVREGTACRVLIGEGQRSHADLVVMGTHGRGGISKAFFGSTTEALLRRYHGAVMVIPPRCSGPDQGWPHGTVEAVIGEGTHRRAMVSTAARTAEVFGAWLRLTPLEKPARGRSARPPFTVLPLPDAARLSTFRQGTAAYHFVCRARGPVMVVRTGHPIGLRQFAAQAA